MITDPRIKRLLEVLDLAMGEDCFTYSEPDTHYSQGKRVCTCCGTETGKHSKTCAAQEIRGLVDELKEAPGVPEIMASIDPSIQLSGSGVPRCAQERCQHYDGKRCALTGYEPEMTCEPVVSRLVKG